MGKFQEHGFMLYLGKDLYLATIKLQADKRLGRSYSTLLPFVTGLYYMGYITKPTYLRYKQKYSTPLDTDPRQTQLEEHKQTREALELERMFGQVINQFDAHKDKDGWVETWIQKAQSHSDITNARKLLALIVERRPKK